MFWAEIGIGDDKFCKQWYPVVPDSYLSKDLLLGCDTLGQTTFHWDGSKGVIMWNNYPYVVRHIHRDRKKVREVRTNPVELSNSSLTYSHINLLVPECLGPYQTKFASIPVKETSDTTLLVYPV